MTRDQFMTDLAMGLSDMPKDVAKELLTDMDEYFRDGINQGKTEEQICEQLGSVDDFIALFKEMESKRSSSKEVSVFMRKVNITVRNGDIHLASGNYFEVVYDQEYYDLTTNDHGDQQDIELKPKQPEKSWSRLIDLALNNANNRVDIKVPSTMNTIDVSGDYGDIKAKGVNISSMVLSTDKGDIEVDACSGDDLHVANHLGDIDINRNTFKNIDAKTDTGDITIEHDGGTINAKSNLGDICVKGMVDTMELNGSKGDIEFDGVLNDNGHIKTQLGDIDVICDDVTIHASSKLGDIDGNGCQGNGTYRYGSGEATLYVSTSAGDITIND